MFEISSDTFVEALSRVGFIVYRRTPEATILERGTRAVVVPTRQRLEGHLLGDLRRMSGVRWSELRELLS
jgi:hypothetical protein